MACEPQDKNHERIWLAPPCACERDDRTWCQDPVNICEECEAAPVEYVRADIPRAEIERLTRERDALRAAVLHVREIIKDGATTGFNCLDGDWADRLFASQAITYAALRNEQEICPRCHLLPADNALLGNAGEGHICGECWTQDRHVGEQSGG
jgi:hypothetical protein